MLLEVLLVEDGSDADLLTKLACRVRRQVLIDLRLLVRVVELESTKLVLNALNDDLRDLIQLILPGILVALLLLARVCAAAEGPPALSPLRHAVFPTRQLWPAVPTAPCGRRTGLLQDG